MGKTGVGARLNCGATVTRHYNIDQHEASPLVAFVCPVAMYSELAAASMSIRIQTHQALCSPPDLNDQKFSVDERRGVSRSLP